MITGAVELVVVSKHNRENSTQGASDRLEQSDASLDVGLHLGELRLGQARRLVENVAANVQLADVVKQRRGPHVFDTVVVEPHPNRNLGGVDGHAPRVVLCVLVLRYEVAKDQQDAVVGVSQFADLLLLVIVERPHEIGGDHQRPTPG